MLSFNVSLNYPETIYHECLFLCFTNEEAESEWKRNVQFLS